MQDFTVIPSGGAKEFHDAKEDITLPFFEAAEFADASDGNSEGSTVAAFIMMVAIATMCVVQHGTPACEDLNTVGETNNKEQI